jgi:DNA-binding SARP family transcriptional activator
MAVRLSLLGGFEARLDDGPPLAFARTRAQALLAFLALNAGPPHPRDKLAALLWGGASHESARHALRQALLALRQVLPPGGRGPLRVETDTIGLDGAGVTTDVAEFERLVALATPDALAAAADLYRGDLLAGLGEQSLAFEEWLVAERARLHEIALEALARLLAHQTRHDLAEPAIRTAVRLLALDPLQEAVHRTLMRLYARQGRRSAALRQYQVCVSALHRELGVEPEPETRQLYRELVRQPGASPGRAPRPDFVRVTPETPLIGRAREVEHLREALREALAGRGGVVVVLGEAGVGKTRVLQALVEEGVRAGARPLVGRSHESEQVLAFGPWAEGLRAGEVLTDGTAVAGLTPAHRATLARVFAEPGASGPGFGAGPETLLVLFEAFAQLFAALGAGHPLLVILEDLQWADELSVRLLGFVARRLSGLPILIVASAREEEVADAPRLRELLDELERDRLGRRLDMAPLSRSDIRDLVRAMTGRALAESDLERLAERVWQASDGNPFAAVETVRALRQEPGVATAGALPVPERVRAFLRRRVERLSAHARQLVTAAAVAGREFEFALVQRAAALDEREAADALEELVRRRLVHGVGDRFDFTHDRVRAAIYGDALLPTREVLHAAVGRELERRHAGRLHEVTDQLAYHYARSADDAKAVEHLARFADEAARRYALADATTALEAARTRAERLPAGERERRDVELVLRLGHLAYLEGRIRGGLDLLLGAHDRVDGLGDPTLTGPYWAQRAWASSFVGAHAAAAEAAQRALAEAVRSNDDATAGKAYHTLAQEAYWTSDLRAGAAFGRRAVAHLELTPERWWLGHARWILARNLTLLGELAAARETATRILDAAEATADARLECYALWTLGWIAAAGGDIATGLEYCARAGRRAPDPVGRVDSSAALGYVQLEAGDPAAAVATLEDAVRGIEAIGARRPWGLFSAMLADAHRESGRPARAQEMAGAALAAMRDLGYGYGAGWAERALGRVHVAQGAHGDARTSLTGALGAFVSAGARLEVGRTHLDLARLAGAAGDRDAAVANVADARAAFEALALPVWVERANALAREFA